MIHHDGTVPLAGSAEFPTVASLGWHLASHRLGSAKPDPAIYEAFEAETGYRGREVLFFDDLEPNVHAARSIGWNSERIDPTQQTAPQLRTWLDRYGLT
jgi:FMN phosphatase YigB (HAD superfamily)